MRVIVHYTTQIKAAIGVAQESIELPHGAGIPELFRALEQRHGDTFHRLVFSPEGSLLPSERLHLR